MKQAEAKDTARAFEKPRRGRPPLPHSKTPARRLREFIRRSKFNFLTSGTRDEE